MVDRESRVVGPQRYFPALDGLRALSVLAVIAFHAEVPGASGGFLGVEVFFVVSGFLITSLLRQERRQTGAISLPAFWLRRARRLLPALCALLIVTLVLSLTVAPDSLTQTRSDTYAALLYVSNWWQIVHHHSYFMAVERPPVLLHLWSLAVEEQFYLFWPLAIALLGRYGKRWLGPLALGVALASAARMAWLFDPLVDPTRVYIGSDTRLCGLLLGAALAANIGDPLGNSAPPARAWQRVALELLATGGLCGALWALSHFTSHEPFLYRGGLVLVDLTTLALIVGLVTPTFIARILGTAPLTWLGRRSYGLYLWHWPVFACTRPDLDLTLAPVPLLLLRLALTFAVSEWCYRFMEMPVRRAGVSALLRHWRTRPAALCAGLGLGAAAALGLICISSTERAAASPSAEVRLASASVPSAPSDALAIPDGTASAGHEPPATILGQGAPLSPSWPKSVTLLGDSVALGLSKSLPLAMPSWRVEVLGRPALMVKQVVPEFLNARSVGSVVVIGLGYNSLFERDRKNYQRWSVLWDRGAEKLLADLKACGAKKLVWITLREPAAELVTDAGRDQYQLYAWFFPYVNERIRALAQRHPELSLADWQAVSNVPDLTKDLIHLNPTGVALLTDTITREILGPAPESTWPGQR